MFDILGGRSDTAARQTAERNAEAQKEMSDAQARIKTALSQAFGRTLQDADVSVSRVQPRGFRVFISPSVLPPKPKFSMFGFELPSMRRRPMGSEINAAIVNVGTAAKRRFFLRLFPERRGTAHASHLLRDEESLSRLAAECTQRLGSQAPLESETKGKQEADTKAKTAAETKAGVEAQTKASAGPLSPPAGVPSGMPGLPPGLLGGMPGAPVAAPASIASPERPRPT